VLTIGGARELADLLTGRSRPCVVVAGAAVSSVPPSRLPAAEAWKAQLLRALAAEARCRLSTAEVHQLAASPALKLEAVLAELDEHGELGRSLVAELDAGAAPNPLHRLLARGLLDGSVRAVVTPNFDGLLTAALLAEARALGVVLPRGWADPWVITRPWRDDALIYQVHGASADPATLRHSFRTINAGFPPDVRAGVAALLAEPLVCLGWAATDPDLLQTAARGEPVWFLQYRACTDPAQAEDGARNLAAPREVRVVGGGFAAVFAALGWPDPGFDSSGASVEAATRAGVAALAEPEALAVLSACTYRASVADRAHRAIDDLVLETQRQRRHIQPDSYWAARAARAQQRGGALLTGPATATVLFARAALASGNQRRWSDSADTLVMLGYGLVPGLRRLTRHAHAHARRAEPPGPERARLALRQARDLASSGRLDAATTVIEEGLQETAGDMYLEAHLLRWRAIVRARQGRSGWLADLDAARDLFTFEGRTLELADLLRTRAFIVAYATGDTATARALLDDALKLSDETGNVRGRARTRFLARIIDHPRLVRILITLM
jgi:hypothetical protein